MFRAGEIYTMGNAEQGQLGRCDFKTYVDNLPNLQSSIDPSFVRIMEKFCHRGGRRGIETFLKPDQIHVKVHYTVAENLKCTES